MLLGEWPAATMHHGRLQGACRLAEGTRRDVARASNRDRHSARVICADSQSDGSRGNVNPSEYCRRARQESDRDFARFLRYAINSGCELEYHVMLARDMGVIPEKEGSSLLSEVIEVRKMLHGLLTAVRKDKPAQTQQADDTVSNESSPLPADKAWSTQLLFVDAC